MKHSTTLFNAQQGHEVLNKLYAWAKPRLIAGQRLVVSIEEEKRSLEQNRRLWAMLTDISRQVDWYGQKLTQDEWKHVFTAAMRKQKVVPGLDGWFVVLGQSTSQMTKGEMSEMQELMSAFGAERGVEFINELGSNS